MSIFSVPTDNDVRSFNRKYRRGVGYITLAPPIVGALSTGTHGFVSGLYISFLFLLIAEISLRLLTHD
jgi:hypothetical protein